MRGGRRTLWSYTGTLAARYLGASELGWIHVERISTGLLPGSRAEGSFDAYLRGALKIAKGGIGNEAVAKRLAELQIQTIGFEQWRGF